MEAKIPKRVVPVNVGVSTGSDGTVTITCTPNPAPIDVGASNVLICFALVTPGYRFRAAKAIELDVPVDDFPYASWTISDTSAALYDRNKVADELSYTVNIVDTTTGQEYSVDPEILNGGGGTGTGDADC